MANKVFKVELYLSLEGTHRRNVRPVLFDYVKQFNSLSADLVLQEPTYCEDSIYGKHFECICSIYAPNRDMARDALFEAIWQFEEVYFDLGVIEEEKEFVKTLREDETIDNELNVAAI